MTRCAIYTRKSSDERLDAEYSSLDNQRAYCTAYIASQGGSGWVETSEIYDDGGFSGGNLKRPALTRLRADIAAGKLDMVVVYKIDRLSRSLRDFANLVAEFEAAGVTFAAVTQSFDTSTSMGRLTLNVLLSFAQFERELTGDRLRDWFAGARARGLWMTGPRPLGYRVEDGHLLVIEEEADLVRRMYRLYPRFPSAWRLAQVLTAEGHLNHKGRTIRSSYIIRHIETRLYRGELPHKAGFLPGHHDPIVTEREWRAAQAAIAAVRRRQKATKPADHPGGPLRGLLYSMTGHAMVHCPVRGRSGQRYRYYVSSAVKRYGPGSCPAGRFRADELEGALIAVAERLAGDLRRPRSPAEQLGLVHQLIVRADIGPDDMLLALKSGGQIRAPVAGRIAETKRTLGWWRAPEIRDLIFSGRPDTEIAAMLGLAYGSVSRIRFHLNEEALHPPT